RVMKDAPSAGIEDQRQAVERMLGILAAAPEERNVKLELMVNRIAHRLNLKEETVWTRLKEMRSRRKNTASVASGTDLKSVLPGASPNATAPAADHGQRPIGQSPAAKHEIELLEALLADGALVGQAMDQLAPGELEHPGLRSLLEGLYRLHAEGRKPDLDHLRGRLDNE